MYVTTIQARPTPRRLGRLVETRGKCGDPTASGGGATLNSCITGKGSFLQGLGDPFVCGDITARGGTTLADCLLKKRMGLGDVAPPLNPFGLPPGSFQPISPIITQAPVVLPAATPDTIRAAAALPNAPAIVKQTAASLPANPLGFLSNEVIAGTGITWWMVGGGAAALAVILIAKKH